MDFNIIQKIESLDGIRETTVKIGDYVFVVTNFYDFERELEQLIEKYQV